MKSAVINQKGLRRVRAGHPWVFRSDLVGTDASDGEAIHVMDPAGRPAGTAFYSAGSQIALRFLSRRQVDATPEFFKGRLEAALWLRERLYHGSTTSGAPTGAIRLFFGESDGIPALIIDRYGPVVVIQTLCPGSELLKGLVADWCMSLDGVKAVVERNDVKVRSLERLPILAGAIRGTMPDVVDVREGPLTMRVDVLHGQKTGAFLDQRDNRELVAQNARGRVLDAFCYQGWFSMRAALKAVSVTSIDISTDAVSLVAENAARLGLKNIEPLEANAFDYMRECDLRGEQFGTVILDPPAFAKNRDSIDGAVRGYKEINLRAIKILEPGGLLFTFSCSYHMGETMFFDTIREAAADAGRRVYLVRRLQQSLDHPIMLGFQESAYLKGLMLRVE